MKKKMILSILLSFAIMLTMMPGMSLTAFAEAPGESGGGTVIDNPVISTIVVTLAENLTYTGEAQQLITSVTWTKGSDDPDLYLRVNNGSWVKYETDSASVLRNDALMGTYAGNYTVYYYNDNILPSDTEDGTMVGTVTITATAPDIYVAGNGTSGNPWVNGESWNPSAASNKMTADENGIYTISYDNVPAGSYEFKFAENGTWDTSYGFPTTTTFELNKEYDISTSSGEETNIGFTLTVPTDITITFDYYNKKFKVASVSKYPLYVGGTQVTSANASNITEAETATASYDATSKTLTLNGFTYEGNSDGIKYSGSDALNISFKGTNTISSTGENSAIDSGEAALNFSGKGTLKTKGYYGIRTTGRNSSITIESGTINAEGTSCGISVEDPYIIVGENVTSLIVIGGNNAIKGKVKNAIAGTGWTDAAGTEGEAEIAISTDGQSLTDYKKVQFPAEAYTVAFGANGHGTAPETQTVNAGGKVTEPTDPTADDYTFGGWYKEAACTNVWDFDTDTVTANTTLYAKWTISLDGDFTVTIKTLTGSSFEIKAKSTTTVANLKAKIRAAQTSYKDYSDSDIRLIFAGKVLDDSKTLSDCNIQKESTIHIVVNYTLTYKYNDGTTSDGKVYNLKKLPDAFPTPTRDGYTFDGWYTDEGLTTAATAGADISSDTTLYAKWTAVAASDPTITEQPADLTLTYGYNSGSISVSATAAEGHNLSYQWYSNTSASTEGGTKIDEAADSNYTIPTGKNAGTTEYYYCVITATRADNSQTASVTSSVSTVTVNKADPTVIAPTAKTGLSYTGKAQKLINAGSTNDGTLYYAVTTKDSAPTDGWSTSIPEKTDAGTYYVWYKVVGDDNHNDVAAASLTALIDKADLTDVSVSQSGTLTYTGEAQTATVNTAATAVNSQAVTFTYSSTESGEYAAAVPAFTNAGSYTVYYKASAANHSDTSGKFTVTIDRASIADAVVTLSEKSLTYTGSAQSVTVSGVKLGDTTLGAGTDYEVSGDTSKTAAGSYTVTVTGKGNYKGSAAAQWSITAAVPVISIAPTASAITYGKTLADSTLSGGTAKLGDNEVAGTFVWETTGTAPAVSDSQTTEYTVVFTPEDTTNYSSATCKVKLTVNRANIKVYVTIDTWIYGKYDAEKNAPKLTSESTNPENGAVTYSYAAYEAGRDEKDLTYSEEIPTDAGDYVVRAQVAQTANYNTGTGYATFTIYKADAAFTAPAAETLTYNGQEQKLVTEGTSADGEMQYALGENGDSAPADGWSTAIPERIDAGTYYVWYRVIGDKNHNNAAAACLTATIKKLDVSVTIVGKNSTNDYDGKVHTVTGYTAKADTDLYNVDGDITFSGTASASQTNVGTAYMNLTAEQFANNNANFGTVTFAITDGYQTVGKISAKITIVGSNSTAIYDGKKHTATGYTAKADTDLYNVDNDITFSGTASASQTGAGTAYMGLAAGQFTNNNENFENVVFEVTDGYQTVTAKDISGAKITLGDGLTYNGSEQTQTISGVTADGLNVTYDVSGNSVTNAGDYTLTVAGNGNFTGTAAAEFTVSRAPLTVTANDNTISYKEEPAGNGVEYDGFVNEETESVLGGTLAYSFSYEKNGKPGKYTITPSGLTSDNYEIEFVEGKLTVENKVSVVAAKGIAKGKTKVKLTWNKVTRAASYEVWMARVGTKYKAKKVKTLNASKTSFTKKKLKKNTAYKFYVIAKDSSGNVISKSRLGRTITGNVRGKYTNAKKLKVSKASVTLSKGGTAKIKATQTKARKSRKLYKPESTALLRYRSDNKAVATVDANGKIKAVGSGWCRIYVQTVNGIWKAVEVTVK